MNQNVDLTEQDIGMLIKCIRITEMEYGECNDLDLLKDKLRKIKNQEPICHRCGHGIIINE